MSLISFFELDIFWWLVILYFILFFILQFYSWADLYKWNPFRKPDLLTQRESELLLQCFPIYGKMSVEHKLRFEKRMFWFRRAKEFKFLGEVSRQEDLKLVLSASLTLLTMGLSHYRYMRSLDEIAIYPNKYFSRITRQYHFGEYAPTFKRVIISAEQFWKGFEKTEDNRNLAMHEFAHALSFDLIKQISFEGLQFRSGLKKIKKLFKQPSFSSKLTSSTYFREYGMTNLQEFFSVAVENYVETPTLFRKEFPDLYAIMKRMLAFDFLKA